MTTADRVRDLVTEAWANWHHSPPAALTKADPALVAAELERRRQRARQWCANELDHLDRLEQRIRDARGTLT